MAYGSATGVGKYILAVNFTTGSAPFTTGDVTAMGTAVDNALDMGLRAAGFTVPVTHTTAAAILGDISDKRVAASIIERMVLGREPSASKVESAGVWRDEAENALQGILDGTALLASATALPKAGGGTWTGSAGIHAGTQAAFPRSVTDEFTEHYGGLENEDT